MKPIWEAQQISYRYPGSAENALDECSIRFPTGKKIALCGHNGSGKSTLFLQAVGLLRPDQGHLVYQNERYMYARHKLNELRQRIGLVFQDPEHQLILNTPIEDIAYGLRNAGMAEALINERSYQMLRAMGLSAYKDTPIHHLSLGQKKRVALAGVLVLEPDLLLLDEPTAYLDRTAERQLLGELDRVHQQGMTIVMATHDMDLAYSWADWVMVMAEGKCQLSGTPHDIFIGATPLQAFGLELPTLLKLWQALPESLRGASEPPRTVEQWTSLFSKQQSVLDKQAVIFNRQK